MGRLVSDKGPDLLLRAIARLKSVDLRPQLTIVGAGPEDASLRAIVKELEIQSQVSFAGVKRGWELAELLNHHKIMVVPSLFHEPFGVVALEGIACGCVVVGSEGGGLKDAVGSCGITFPNGDEQALADRLETLLTVPESQRPYRAKAAAHLSLHTKGVVAEAYVRVLEATLYGMPIQSAVAGPAPRAESLTGTMR